MSEFIRAILERNAPGAIYQDTVFDRRLLLYHPGSKLRFSVFDGFERISSDLAEGKQYEFILYPVFQHTSLKVSDEIQAINNISSWSGKIVDVNWIPEVERYHYSQADLGKEKWVLLSTSLGHIIMLSQDIEAGLQREAMQSEIILWENMRVDLCAVVREES